MNEADDIWKPLPEPNPETLRLQMVVLMAWLQRPAISVSQAACLLAGVCPPERDYDDRLIGAYLPGRQEWEIEPEIGKTLLANEIDELKTLLTEAKTPEVRSLAQFLVLGLELGKRPPWLEYAVKNAECKKLLPQEVTNTLPLERPIQIANREKAFKKRDGDDKYKLTIGAGRDEFERLRDIQFQGHTREDGSPNKSSVARSILDVIREAVADESDSLIPSSRTVERYVSKWLSEDSPDSAPAPSDNAGAQVAK